MDNQRLGLVQAAADGRTRTFAVGDPEYRLEFTGRVLGLASGQRSYHLPHRDEFAAPGERCGACRWTEVTIYKRRLVDGFSEQVDESVWAYVVHTVGRSVVPGEVDLPKVVETSSPYEVVEALTVRRSGPRGEVFMPPQHLRALSAAAQWDDGIRDAYINRAVV
jgi:hypothetical protein